MSPTGLSEAKALSIGEVDWLVARFVWLERRRFEILGSWVTSVPEFEVAVLLATQARHHAWHASLWEEHLPQRSGYLGRVRPPAGAALAAFLGAVAGPASPADSVVRLAGAFGVLGPRARAAYSGLLARTTTVSDAAIARTCRLVLADQQTDGLLGEEALRALLATTEQVEQARRQQAELEGRLTEAGGLLG